MKDSLVLGFILSFILIISLPVWGDSTNDANSQTNSSGSNTLEDKQTQQQAQLHLLPMGQMYPLTPLTRHHIQQCLKMCVAWVLVVPFLLLALAYLGANI